MNNYHYRRGGSDVVYLDHGEMFADHGWETAFFSMNHPQNMPTAWSRYFVEEIELGNQYSGLDKVRFAAKVIYSGEATSKLGRLLDGFPADVVHGHIVHHHLSPAVYRLTKARGIPTVMTAHDLKLGCPAYKMLNAKGVCEKCKDGNLLHLIRNRCIHNSATLSALVFVESFTHRLLDTYRRNLDRIIAPSRFYRDKLIEWGWSPESIIYVPNYVDSKRIDPSTNRGKYYLYFGRLAPEKGVATLLKAAHAAGVRLVLAGTGPLDRELRALSKAIGSTAEFVGYQTGKRLADLMRDSLAVVLPSEWYENAPMSILESYAYGKPVIGARIGGIPELIEEGVTGLLFETGNIMSLTACLGVLASMPGDRVLEMGQEARRKVEREFSPAGYYESVCDVYRSVGLRI